MPRARSVARRSARCRPCCGRASPARAPRRRWSVASTAFRLARLGRRARSASSSATTTSAFGNEPESEVARSSHTSSGRAAAPRSRVSFAQRATSARSALSCRRDRRRPQPINASASRAATAIAMASTVSARRAGANTVDAGWSSTVFQAGAVDVANATTRSSSPERPWIPVYTPSRRVSSSSKSAMLAGFARLGDDSCFPCRSRMVRPSKPSSLRWSPPGSPIRKAPVRTPVRCPCMFRVGTPVTITRRWSAVRVINASLMNGLPVSITYRKYERSLTLKVVLAEDRFGREAFPPGRSSRCRP